MTAVYFDEHMLVLNKPSGLLSVPGRGPDKQDCLSKRVQAIYPDALVVHRLDQYLLLKMLKVTYRFLESISCL